MSCRGLGREIIEHPWVSTNTTDRRPAHWSHLPLAGVQLRSSP